MIELIISKLLEYFPQIAGYGLLVVIVIWLTYKTTCFYVETKGTNKSLPKFGETLNKIHTGLMTLNTVLVDRAIISASCYSDTNSPRVINELGKKVLHESRADQLLERLQPELLQALEQKPFGSLLELERQSFATLLEKSNSPDFKSVQNFVFEHPVFEGNPLSYENILFVMSLKLRDAYRGAHPEKDKELSE